ncbi:MAG: response regulator [Actinobacteria bacterium]|nr:MAG: response regulator [Actinomycetota bacterium]
MKKILIVDDEASVCAFVKFKLEKQGYRVFIAYNGEEALEIAEKENPDLVILDIIMPEMDGYEVLERIRNDLNNKVPIMFLTSKKSNDDIYQGWQAGAACYITKPFTDLTLMQTVRLCLEKAS